MAKGEQKGNREAKKPKKAPSAGKILVVFRQCPDRMDMIGQNTDCDGFERVAFSNGAVCASQTFNFLGQ